MKIRGLLKTSKNNRRASKRRELLASGADRIVSMRVKAQKYSATLEPRKVLSLATVKARLTAHLIDEGILDA